MLVWTGSAFPQSFLSCKQSDAERKDFVDIPEQGHSWFYSSLRLVVSFVEEIKLLYKLFLFVFPLTVEKVLTDHTFV